MTVRNPLFEFMPYGAPELLSAQRSHMVRALALASLLALTVFALARALGLAMPADQQIVISSIPRNPMSIEPPPSIRSAQQLRIPEVVQVSPPVAGQFVAVQVDKLAPTELEMPAISDVGGTDVPGTPQPAPLVPGSLEIAPETLPTRVDYVYVDELPVLAKSVKPDYPEMPRELGIEGRVYVHMLVGKDGRVVRAEVDEKINVPMLNKAALDAALKWVFQPALVNRHPVAVWVAEGFIFKINQ